MAGKRYSEMTNEELTDKACQIAYSRKKAGEQHANLIYALAFRIREIESQEAPAAPTRLDTVALIEAHRGLSPEARKYLIRRNAAAAREEVLRRDFVMGGGRS